MSGEDGGSAQAPGLPTRRAAYRAVRRVHEHGAWASPAVDAEIAGLDARSRAFAANLAFQTLRWEGTLDWALGHALRRSADPEVQDVLRLGAWQIGFGRTPARAAVSTAVELVRSEIGPQAGGFVNAVLRTLARTWTELPWPDEGTDEGLGLALGYPAWIVAEARARFGGDARAVLEAGNEPPGLTLRASPGDADALVAELAEDGHQGTRGRLAADAVRVPGADPGRLSAVAQGRATPQDEASMVVGEVLLEALRVGAEEGAGADAGVARPSVLDACAGPGGKATHLAARGAAVTAADVHPHRARLVATLAERLGLDVGVVAADGTLPPWPPASFDGVLLDVPCSGLGVVRRRPELRWRQEPGDVRDLQRLQAALVDQAVGLVRAGGVLVYSACTWTVGETTAVVRAALRRHQELAPAGQPPGWRSGGEPGVFLRPDLHGTDGMYIACLRHT